MSFLGASKIVALALSIIGSTFGGGAGFSYVLKNKNNSEMRKKRNLERQERERLRALMEEERAKAKKEVTLNEIADLNSGLKAEAFLKGMTDGTYRCWQWSKSIHESPEVLGEPQCQQKIQEALGEDLANKPEKWFRSNLETAIAFFEKHFKPVVNKYHVSREKKEGGWETKDLKCKYTEDIQDKRKVVVRCDKKNSWFLS
ncbi:hypothetical protein MSUIS_01440 [Mycoplasma suis KI3806]|uniref:Uncharacterized protein n=1 Tax=Mycoplasma suis (strain KI_3806) TaxID=708248 RepID=F0V315_MYCS3|nr:hypothetical protein [Mycoplasma suis]CBZ40237.1 hypothetical protein MSUIS_01440 [Mycoplasma suis KI3806]